MRWFKSLSQALHSNPKRDKTLFSSFPWLISSWIWGWNFFIFRLIMGEHSAWFFFEFRPKSYEILGTIFCPPSRELSFHAPRRRISPASKPSPIGRTECINRIVWKRIWIYQGVVFYFYSSYFCCWIEVNDRFCPQFRCAKDAPLESVAYHF